MATRPDQAAELKVDPNSLYLEEIFTDRRVGTIRRLTPVNKAGTRDQARPVLYVGETQVLTPAGALPIAFEIGVLFTTPPSIRAVPPTFTGGSTPGIATDARSQRHSSP